MVGIVLTATGIITGIVSVLVGILELINAGVYWSTPPSSTSAPKYVAVLEIVNVISLGSLWSPFAGFANLSRLRSREVKGYLALLQAGGSLPAVTSAALADQVKRCPRCASRDRTQLGGAWSIASASLTDVTGSLVECRVKYACPS